MAKEGSARNRRVQGNLVRRQNGRTKTRSDKPRLIDDPIQEEKVLKATLASMGFYALDTLGDGNCLFRALADQLDGSFDNHLRIRTEICDYLADHADRFRSFVDQDEGGLEGHIASMRIPKTYGTNLELSAFANLYNRPVRVFQPGLVYVIQSDKATKAHKEIRPEPIDDIGEGAASPVASTSSAPSQSTADEAAASILSARAARLEARKARQSRSKSAPIEADSEDPQSSSSCPDPLHSIHSPHASLKHDDEPINLAYHSYEHYSSLRKLDATIGMTRSSQTYSRNGSRTLPSRPRSSSQLIPTHKAKRDRIAREEKRPILTIGDSTAPVEDSEPAETTMSEDNSSTSHHPRRRPMIVPPASGLSPAEAAPRQRSLRVESPASSQEESAASYSSSEASGASSPAHERESATTPERASHDGTAATRDRPRAAPIARLTGRDKKELRRQRKRELRSARTRTTRPIRSSMNSQDSPLELSGDVAVLYI